MDLQAEYRDYCEVCTFYEREIGQAKDLDEAMELRWNMKRHVMRDHMTPAGDGNADVKNDDDVARRLLEY